jgi:hypothetical protein
MSYRGPRSNELDSSSFKVRNAVASPTAKGFIQSKSPINFIWITGITVLVKQSV